MKQIPLANGKGVTLVDDADFELAARYRWHIHTNGYAHACLFVDGKVVGVYLHRLLLNAPEGKLVDHIDRNRLNNCRTNLRIVDHGQNRHNLGLSRTSRTGVRGVYWNEKDGCFRAQVRVRGRKVHQSRHTTLEAAAEAVRKARRLHMSHSQEAQHA